MCCGERGYYIDLSGANSHLIQSRLKLDVTPYTPLGGKELSSPNRCNTNSNRPEIPTKQRYSINIPLIGLPSQETLWMAAFCYRTVLQCLVPAINIF